MFAIWTITQLLACKACQEQKIAPVDTGERYFHLMEGERPSK